MKAIRSSAVRSSSFSETLNSLVLEALRLASHSGELPPIAVLARSIGINRTSAYYYFGGREALLGAIRSWTIGQLLQRLSCTDETKSVQDLTCFVLTQPFAIKLVLYHWVGSDRTRHDEADWEDLVTAVRAKLQIAPRSEYLDAETHLAWLLGGVLLGPLLLRCFAKGGLSDGRVAEKIITHYSTISLS